MMQGKNRLMGNPIGGDVGALEDIGVRSSFLGGDAVGGDAGNFVNLFIKKPMRF